METTANRIAISYGSDTYDDVLEFLYREAEELDERRHHEWLDMLTQDVRYLVPVRITSAHSLDDSALEDMAHFDEDRYSLGKRVARFDTEHAWAEDPPSRTRRFVTNVRAWEGDAAGELVVRSNILLFRSRGDIHDHDLLSGGRTDVLRRENGALRLARRTVLLDESVLRTQNLAVFL
ncbi:3-phenylpropionate/cinnamic acid dioxygenase subunit beta [Capillimicrobium parvum]|uniref:Biphenyl dioxygenase subunit beta n=1 Tax=Capillimicrobium parvum TaxID=2884022 RepID=A0A9E6XVR9_9ACTN|nr:3-phenylpropionate/cinnamic acid dioxygenase subunit beta [Capillimicrobium parvum]UGS35321.1 Biphenyl dioxygenase subunit beta [Capillimicrobium parvum]